MEIRRPAIGFAIASLVLGILSIVTALLMALLGLVAGVVGLALGIRDYREGGRGMTLAGIITSGCGIGIALFNYALTIYLIQSNHLAR
ncbi:MAG TPA: DUF4190 domain-containing protein [Candidatus Dormibacteraeota bacterium]